LAAEVQNIYGHAKPTRSLLDIGQGRQIKIKQTTNTKQGELALGYFRVKVIRMADTRK